MSIKKIEFSQFVTLCEGVKIVGDKLIVIHDVVAGYNITEKMFPGDDRDRIPYYKKEAVEFLLPKNHKLSIEFASDFTITFEEIEGVNYFIEIDVFYETDWENFQEGMAIHPAPWSGNDVFDIKDYD